MTNVQEALESAKNKYKKIFYLANRGNAGDSLINCGFYSLAKKISLEYHAVGWDYDFSTISRDELLILPGGGYVVSFWHSGAELLGALLSYEFPIIFLPQSFEGQDAVLKNLRSADLVFCREGYSFEYLRSLNLQATLAMDHDMAFHFDEPYVRSQRASHPRLSAKNIMRMALVGFHCVRSRFKRHMPAWRTDHEAEFQGRGRRRHDLSLIAKLGNQSEAENALSALTLLFLIRLYEVVDTDRLHVIIGCIIAETTVNAHANAYYKIAGVHKYSILPHKSRNSYVNWLSS